MSQIILDEHLDLQVVVPELEPWITVVRLTAVRPGEDVQDDRVPAILRTLKTPTFITIDQGFWNRGLCHPGYCIVVFELRTEEQHLLPAQLRRLFHLPGFQTRAERMGKVARVQDTTVQFWEAGKKRILELPDPE